MLHLIEPLSRGVSPLYGKYIYVSWPSILVTVLIT